MAKASISLRLEPHELHIVKESLRLMSLMMETMLENNESITDYEFNPGVYENAHVMRIDLEEMRIALGMEMDRPVKKQQVSPPTKEEHDPGLNLLENFRHGYRTARMAKRAARLLR